MPPLPINLEAITQHLTTLAATQSCPRCDIATTTVITDAIGLLAALAQLRAQLARTRLDNANLRAAINAALGAAEDGESDPLDYLRWELPEHGDTSPDPGRGRL
jgi:hypothetical protein